MKNLIKFFLFLFLAVPIYGTASEVKTVTWEEAKQFPTCDTIENLNGTHRTTGTLGDKGIFYLIKMNPANVRNLPWCIVSANKIIHVSGIPKQHDICGNKVIAAKKIVQSPAVRTVRHVVSKPQLKVSHADLALLGMNVGQHTILGETLVDVAQAEAWGRIGAAAVGGFALYHAAGAVAPAVVTQTGGGANSASSSAANTSNQNLFIEGEGNTGAQGANW